jgi:hypothetical protein
LGIRNADELRCIAIAGDRADRLDAADVAFVLSLFLIPETRSMKIWEPEGGKGVIGLNVKQR